MLFALLSDKHYSRVLLLRSAIILQLIMNFSVLILSNLTLALLIAQGPEIGIGPVPSPSQEIKSEALPGPESLVDDPANNRYWRMTRDGWQLIELPAEILAPVFRPARPIPRIHPFQATMLISLAALAAMAWASDEWDWGRLVGDKSRETRVE